MVLVRVVVLLVIAATIAIATVAVAVATATGSITTTAATTTTIAIDRRLFCDITCALEQGFKQHPQLRLREAANVLNEQGFEERSEGVQGGGGGTRARARTSANTRDGSREDV